ncbi:MAG: nucleotidyltransferase family protein [Chloroflexi bacterium]|nr:nucleotidyltransferase family protein [Chloroflexota bacterium]
MAIVKEKSTPTIEEIREKALPILRRYGARRAGVFGSLVRGEMRRRSDIDILVDIPQPIGLFAFVGLKRELEEALGRKVDLVEYETIKARIRERILAEQVPIL